MRFLILCLLSGCTTIYPSFPDPIRNSVTVTVVENPKLPMGNLGRATLVGSHCYIVLKEYPVCLKHEMRHCLEGAWHGNSSNDDDCY